MSQLTVLRRVLCSWFAVLSLAVIVGLLSVTVPTWMHAEVRNNTAPVEPGNNVEDGRVHGVDIGLWEMCRRSVYVDHASNSSTSTTFFNCTQLDQTLVAGWFHAVQVLTVGGLMLICFAVVGLSALLVFGNCQLLVRPHTKISTAVGVISLISALSQLAASVVVGIAFGHHHTLPVCIPWCPSDIQPMASCPNSTFATTPRPGCDLSLGAGYVIGVVSVGLALLVAGVGITVAALLRKVSVYDDDQLLSEDLVGGSPSINAARPTLNAAGNDDDAMIE